MEDNKKINLKFIIVVILCIAICLPLGIWIGLKFIKPVENKQSNEVKEELHEKEDDADVYGYAFVSRLANDGTGNEYYRILELHKDGDDKILATYDVENNSTDLNVYRFNKINDKLYYELDYSSFDSKNNIIYDSRIMYIDLTSNKKEPVELMKWKQKDTAMLSYEINGDYAYLTIRDDNAHDTKYYKYDIKTKETYSITKSEHDLIYESKEPINENSERIDRIYVKGKELVFNYQKNELVYDGEVIYKPTGDASIISQYTFSGDIVIKEYSDCGGYGCYTTKHYKYNVDSKTMEEIDNQTAYSIAYNINIFEK